MSYITNTPVFNLAKILIDPSIQSYHLVDGTILRVANIYRVQTRKIKRVAEEKFWVKRKRNIGM
jgi:hypothetical protein